MKPTPMPRPSISGGQDGVLAGEHFSAGQDDAVDGDQRDEDAERIRSSSGTKACISSWTIVTKPAMTVMKAGMRTLSGMILRKREMIRFEPTRTKVDGQAHADAVLGRSW